MKIKLTIIIFVGLLIALTAFIFNMTKPTYVRACLNNTRFLNFNLY